MYVVFSRIRLVVKLLELPAIFCVTMLELRNSFPLLKSMLVVNFIHSVFIFIDVGFCTSSIERILTQSIIVNC